MICAPIKKKSIKSLIKSFEDTQEKVDLIEIWLDEVKDLSEKDLKKIFSIKKKPIIYKFTGNQKNLEIILKYKIDYIDLDISTSNNILSKIKNISPKTKIILSYHDYKKTPKKEKLHEIAEKMVEKGADIIKIAAYAQNFEDSIRMLEFLSQLTSNGQKAICLCMGEEGRITRVSGHLFKNYLMYAPISIEEKTAEGQIEAQELKKIQNLYK